MCAVALPRASPPRPIHLCATLGRYALAHRLLSQAGGAPELRSIWKRYASLAKPLPHKGVALVQHGSGNADAVYAGDHVASAVNTT
ncbi:MAG: hypothetical protein WCL71_13130, partial [Deltaproteobacteria bacterium]